jgi:hypothetical protein
MTTALTALFSAPFPLFLLAAMTVCILVARHHDRADAKARARRAHPTAGPARVPVSRQGEGL